MSRDRRVWLTPHYPSWPGIGCELLGDVKVSAAGAAAWTMMDRPRRKGFPEFTAVQLLVLDLPLMIDGADTDTDIEPLCAELDMWRYPTEAVGIPPLLEITGPIPSFPGNPWWVIQTIGWGPAIRRHDGQRIQQTFTLNVVEVRGEASNINYYPPPPPPPPSFGAPPPPPPPAGHRQYTVRGGDTLWALAGQFLGDYRRWPEIAQLNNVRDPRTLQIGQTLLLP